MSDYSPLYLPGDSISTNSSGTIVGGACVEVSGDGTVAATSAASAGVVGVAAYGVAASKTLTIFGRGAVHVSVAAGGITAGAQVVSAASGKVAALVASATSGNAAADINTAANNARTILGIAMTTALDTASVQWMEI